MKTKTRILALLSAIAVPFAGTAQAVEPAPLQPSTETKVNPAKLNVGPGARGTVAILPDTQFYSRYGAAENDQYSLQFPTLPNPFDAQTQWIVENQDDLGISMTQHLGDVVDQVTYPGQWAVASRAMGKLDDAGVPYAVIPGNHDCLSCDPWSAAPVDMFGSYQQNFPVSRQAKSSTFQAASPSGLSNAHKFAVAGVPMMSVNLPWEAGDEEIQWAEGVLEANPNVPTILTSHQIINIDASGDPLSTPFGEKLWDRLINNNPQVFLTYNGHHHGATNRVLKNAAGLPVFQQLIDYQMAYQGGNGEMALVEFDFTHNQISQTSFSPWVLQKPQNRLTTFDEALMDNPGSTYTYDFDFAQRFAAIGADFHPQGERTSATASLRDHITSTFTPAAEMVRPAPQGESDYPKVDGTLAHWRPTQNADGSVKFTDITGNGNDMTMHSTGGSARFDSDSAKESSLPASISFDPAAKHLFTYFETDRDAPINAQTFDKGYTYETFIKIDERFGPDNHWMGFISRFGQRKDLPNLATDSDLEEPPAAGAVSSLRELQWAFAENNQPMEGQSLWSSDVPAGQWLHVAVVDTGIPADGGTGSVTMYVNGAPVLRNAYGPHGIAAVPGKTWIMGGSTYADMLSTGFFGKIGESRFVDRPLAPEEWLTARVADNKPAPAAGSSALTSSGPAKVMTAVAALFSVLSIVAGLAMRYQNVVNEFLARFGLRLPKLG
ncbi:LamG-like jellyroll fold domain-containing protein [Corynebacterium epidermidicanis]|uniref:LamG-like jellyroll fold domain-containing protein n=1 Tax=Corynebacterium epidermidicanis TaxID=1050174 RepID=UPI00130E9650|nr:LamG-like jellyroll fold domain-containing protein [Corynebacterium epidermidicanis]